MLIFLPALPGTCIVPTFRATARPCLWQPYMQNLFSALSKNGNDP
ncbi:hypothetical protein CEV34_3810 [Brucella pseudogrignonensis]|uniref:Uncharacterized protein n=1 Tax=Brucella pseudogrignonensis TaxID=419475 RepID=A0A256G7Y8_9HYPH|nr:hypothetical protein CEV34_3810 [Brucella pseudogrignonensis]